MNGYSRWFADSPKLRGRKISSLEQRISRLPSRTEPRISMVLSVCPLSPAKPKITYVENNTAMELDDQVTLTCEASGDPTPSITWRTSTRNISNEEKVLPTPSSSPRSAGQWQEERRGRVPPLPPPSTSRAMLHTEASAPSAPGPVRVFCTTHSPTPIFEVPEAASGKGEFLQSGWVELGEV